MKFLVDAQLPKRLARWLGTAGHDAIHTLDLPHANRSTDQEIIELAELSRRIVVTKDDDFVQSHLVTGRPARMLLIATGNIDNATLEELFRKHLDNIEAAMSKHRLVEINQYGLVIRQ